MFTTDETFTTSLCGIELAFEVTLQIDDNSDSYDYEPTDATLTRVAGKPAMESVPDLGELWELLDKQIESAIPRLVAESQCAVREWESMREWEDRT